MLQIFGSEPVTNAHGTYYYNDINYAQQLVAIDKERDEAEKKR